MNEAPADCPGRKIEGLVSLKRAIAQYYTGNYNISYKETT